MGEATPLDICLYKPGSQKDPHVHVIHLVPSLRSKCTYFKV